MNINEQATMTQLITLTINGKSVSVPKGTTVYNAAKQLGVDIPIFCYQDRMPPFGACRMCLVEVEKMPKLQTSCTLEATEGMVVKTETQMAVDGRKEIIEFLLINHPLDCPVCDRGGECPLQENALNHGPGESRFFEQKRHFKKPLPLGPVLMLDRERCIICARCTRFGDVLAGDHALEFIERGYRTEVGTPDGGPAESKFIGNTIMICPVGALTSQVYRFRARPWDNEPTESTCTLCPVGCSMILDSRDGEIMRTRSRENRDVNDIWLCDKGWFGYEFTSHPGRLQKPLIRRKGKLETASWDEALSLVADNIEASKPRAKLAAFGGNPLTVEENYLFQKLMREGAGVNNLDSRIGMPLFSLDREGVAPGMQISIGACEELSFAVLFGLDLTEEFPVIWLRLRQAINRGAKVIFLGHFAPEIAPYLTETLLHTPGQELEALSEHLPRIASMAEQGKCALFVGSQYLSTPNRSAILAEIAKFQKTLPQASLNVMEGRGNSMGARFAGMRPDVGALGKPLNNPGLNALQVMQDAARNGWDFMYVAGADPVRQFSSKLWQEARSKLKFLVVQDLFMTETARQADVVLPTLSFVEKGGSFLNIEGRVQSLMPGKEIPEGVYSDGEIFIQLAKKLNMPLAVDASFLETLGQKRIQNSESRIQNGEGRIQNSESRIQNGEDRIQNPESRIQNGKLRASYARVLFDQGVRMKHDVHVLQLVKEPRARLHPDEGSKRNIQDGQEVRLSANGNTIVAKVQLDKHVALNTIVLPLGFDDLPVHELGDNLLNGMEIEISR